MEGVFAIFMVFSIPLAAILTHHFRTMAKMKQQAIDSEIELEKLKHENYVIETQKLRLELEQMKLDEAQKEQKSLPK